MPVSDPAAADVVTQAHWNKAMNHEGFFSIYWSAAGDCYSLFLINGSQYARNCLARGSSFVTMLSE